jgi:hypothetical protein
VLPISNEVASSKLALGEPLECEYVTGVTKCDIEERESIILKKPN